MTRAPSLLRLLLASTALTAVPAAAALLAAASPAAAQALPTGASVAYGSVGFQRSSGTLTINQSSPTAIVNYNSFSIGQRNTVNINQPGASSAILNRVTGSTPSTIAGHLNANGQVYLVNPNGIAITRTGVVNVGGGFVASTLGIADKDFIAGKRTFRGNGSSARVTNAGTVTIGRGGYAALIGGEVRNSGTITVPMGKVGLGSGEMATLDVSGDGFLQVAMPTGSRGKGALVSNSGLIAAAGGTVVMDAATARAAAREAVNISGTIDAHSISGHSGSIILGGGAGGSVNVSGMLTVAGRHGAAGGSVVASGRQIKVAGTIDASGRHGGTVRLAASDGTTLTGTVKAIGRHGTGGRIAITGLTIGLAGATVDASGARGGGTVNVGGGRQGTGPLMHAGTVTIDAKSVIRADATGAKGDGGSVVVWSDETTSFAGLITARGGSQGGDGGSAEVSSHGVLDYRGTTVLTAAKGSFGTLLLDPENVTISSAANSNETGFTATGDNSNISTTTLQSALAKANVTVSTGTTGSQHGDITVSNNVSWSSGSTLTLNAAGDIYLNANISGPNGTLALNTTGQADLTSPSASINIGTLTGSVGYASLSSNVNSISTLQNFTATQSLNITDSTPLTLSGTISAGGLNLSSSGTITQDTAATVNAGTANLTASQFAFNNPQYGSFKATGAITFITNGAFTLGHAGSSSYTLTDQALSSISAGSVTLQAYFNNITVAGATVTSTTPITLSATGGTISFGGSGNSASSFAGNLTLSGSTVSQTGPLTVGGTLVVGYGYEPTSVALTNSSNNIATLGFIATSGGGGFALSDAASGGLRLTDPINTGTAPLTLNNTGAITQANGTITTGTLTGSSRGAASFALNGNSISTLGSFTALSADGNTGYNLTVATGGNLTIAAGAAINLAGTSTGGALTLTAGGTITQASGTTVSAQSATLTGTGFTFNDFGVQTTGALTLQSIGSLSLGSAYDGQSYTVTDLSLSRLLSNGSIVLQSTAHGSDAGDIAVVDPDVTTTSPITLASARNISFGGTGGAASTFSGNLILAAPAANSTVTQTGSLAVLGVLAGSGTIGSVALGNTANSVYTLGGFTTAASTGTGFQLSDSSNGGLTLAGSLSTGTGALSLSNTGAITQISGTISAGATSISAQDLTLLGVTTTGSTVLDARTGTLSLQGVTTTNSPLALYAGPRVGSFSLNAAVNSGTAATTITSTDALTLGAANDAAATITDASVNRITAAGVTLQSTNGGPLTVDSPTIAAAAGPVTLKSATDILFGTGQATFSQDLTLNATLDITQGRGGALILTGNTLSGSARGDVTLAGGNNDIATLGAFDTTGGGAAAGAGLSIINRHSGTFGLNGAVTLGAGTLTLFDKSGMISQTAGTITAATLAGSSRGGASFGQANSIAALGDFSDTNNGNLSLTSNAPTLGVTGTVSIGVGTLTLTSTGGGINETGAITAGVLTGSSNGTANFASANGNQIGTLGNFSTTGGSTGHDLAVTTADTLTIGVAGATDATRGVINLAGANGSGTLTLNVGGTITQASNSTIAAAALTGSSQGDASFTGTNGIAALGDFNTGGGNLSLTSGVATLGVTGTVNAGTLTLTNTAGAISQTGGTITAGTLTGSAVGSAAFAPPGNPSGNQITNLGAFSVTGAGNLSLSDGVALTITGAVATPGGTVTLTAGDTVGENGGTITANALALAGGSGSYTLTAGGNPGNKIGTVTANAASLSLVDAQNLSVGAAGVTTSGAVSLATAYDLTLGGTVTGASPVLSAAGYFRNVVGSGAVTATDSGGRWLVYSGSPGGDSFGGLNSQNTAIFDQTIASLPPTSVTQGGNRYVFANQPVLQLSAENVSKTYGQTVDLSSAYTLTGFQGASGAFNFDTAASAMITGAPTITSGGSGAAATVKSYGISIATGTLASGSGYAIVPGGSPGTLFVTQAPLLITASNQSKTYGQTLALGSTAFTTSPLVNNDSVTGVTLMSDGAAAGGNAGTHTITAMNAQGMGLRNYSITYETGTLTVAKAPLTVSGTKTYDGTTSFATSQLSVAGGVNGETVSLTAGSGTTPSADAGFYLGFPLSNLAITVANGNALATNYQLPTTGTLAIGQATITVAGATGVDKTYDGKTLLPTGATGFTYAGVVGSDAVTVAGSAAYASANAGPQMVNVTGLALSGNKKNDYVLSATSVTGSGTISPLAVQVTGMQTYNGTTNVAAGNLHVGNAIQGDTVTLSGSGTLASRNAGSETLLSSGGALTNLSVSNANYTVTGGTGTVQVTPAPVTVTAVATSKTYDGNTSSTTTPMVTGTIYGPDTASFSESYADPNAGTGKPLMLTGTINDGNGGGNYNVNAVTTGITGTINQATLTYVATAASRLYGAANPALTGTVTGFVNNETLSTATTGTLSFATMATTSSNVGRYDITGSGLTAGNYTFRQDPGYATALTVTPAPLTVTGTKSYDTTSGFGTGQLAVAGAVNGDSITLTAGTGAAGAADAGSYANSTLSGLAITVAGGRSANNYALPMTGALVIEQATVTVAGATGVGKTYDGTAALPAGATGFTAAGLYAADTNAGRVTLTAASASYRGADAGPEAIDVAGLALGGTGRNNYRLSATAVTGSGTITPAPVTVTALGGASVYGDAPTNPGLSASGLVAGQGVGVLTGLASSFALSAQSNAGTYALSVAGTNGNSNYRVTATVGGTFTISPRPLTLAALDALRLPGQPDPAFGYTVGGRGLVNGDALSGALATAATQASPPGLYAITQGSLAASANYAVSFVPGTLVVGAALPSAATGLGSTAARAFAGDLGSAEAGLPFAASVLAGEAAGLGVTASEVVPGVADGAADAAGSAAVGVTASQIVAGLGDPRFAAAVVCLNGACTLVPQPTKGTPKGTPAAPGRPQSAAQKTSRLESRPGR